MRFLKTFAILSTGAVGVVGVAAGAGAQPSQEGPSQGQVCSVTVERQDDLTGVFDVTRQVFEDGSCNCFVYTGTVAQPRSTEAQLEALLQSRRCPNARPMMVEGVGAGAGVSGGIRNAAPVALFAGVAGGIVFAIEGDEDPVSP